MPFPKCAGSWTWPGVTGLLCRQPRCEVHPLLRPGRRQPDSHDHPRLRGPALHGDLHRQRRHDQREPVGALYGRGDAQDNFNVDNGTDPHTPGVPTSGNIELDLPAGVDTPLGGPGATAPDYARVIAVAIISTQGRAMTINITEFIDGAAGTCAVDGTILAP